VAALLARLHTERGCGLGRLVNDALRRGLSEMAAPAERGEPLRTRSGDFGRPRVPAIDKVAEALAIAEAKAAPSDCTRRAVGDTL
jgi:hypothetical protein